MRVLVFFGVVSSGLIVFCMLLVWLVSSSMCFWEMLSMSVIRCVLKAGLLLVNVVNVVLRVASSVVVCLGVLVVSLRLTVVVAWVVVRQ